MAGTDPVAVDSYAVTLASWYGKTFEGKHEASEVAGELDLRMWSVDFEIAI